MTKTKRIASMAAATLIAVSMTAAASSMTAFAAPAGTTTVTVPADSTHTYVAYQIFTGTWENDGTNDRLVGAAIGDGVNKDALIAAINAKITGANLAASATDIEIAAALDAADSNTVLAILKTAGVLSTTSTTLAKGDNTLAQGYYYVEETDATGSTKGDILYITDGTAITVSPKIGAPTVEKKIKEDDRTITATGETIGSDSADDGWNDAADYCIGEAVPFKLYGTLPANLNMYNSYFYQFIDDLGDGYKAPKATDFKVYIDGTDVTAQAVIDVSNPHAITITFNDIKAVTGVTVKADSIVSVKFSAVLGTDAVIGELGNTNGVKLKYSNNFNYSGSGIGTPDDGDDTNDDDDFDTTEEDGVVAFTYTVDSTKIDAADSSKKLAGAKFKLLNSDKSQGATIVDGKFAGWTAVENATVFETLADGKFVVAGLDTDTYYISEVEAPKGYNKLTQDIEVVVTKNDAQGKDTTNVEGNWAYTKDDGTAAYGTLAGTYDGEAAAVANGVVSGNIANAKGPQLPETGGIGTKLFYICGGTLAAGAAILLITKKRADKAE